MREKPAVVFFEAREVAVVLIDRILRWQETTENLFADVGNDGREVTMLSTVKGTEYGREIEKEGDSAEVYTLLHLWSSQEPHQHSGNLSLQPDKGACSTLIAVAPTGPVTSTPSGATVTQRTWANDISAKSRSPDGIAWCFDPER